METKKENFIFKNKCFLVLFCCLFIICIAGILILQRNDDIISYIGILFLLLFPCSFFMIVLINTSVNKKNENRMGVSFATNFIFSILSTMFLYNTKYLNINFVPLLNILFLSLVLFIVSKILLKCKSIKIEKGNDLSCLKITNYYMIPIYMVIVYLLETCINKEKASNFSNYFLLPLLAIQGLYELLDRESKREHVTVPEHVIMTETEKEQKADNKEQGNTIASGNATVSGTICVNLEVKI